MDMKFITMNSYNNEIHGFLAVIIFLFFGSLKDHKMSEDLFKNVFTYFYVIIFFIL